MDYYQYNAKDAFVTAMCFIILLLEMPEFAITNYLMEFKVVVPCILSELTGWKIDVEEKNRLTKSLGERNLKYLNSLRVMVDDSNFNPSSPVQVGKLWKALGSEDITSSDKVSTDKVGARHTINRRITTGIGKYREGFSATTKYAAKDFVWNGRCFYSLNPHGTDTGRLSSRESHYNCGLQIQNIKRDSEEIQLKSMFIADDGFYLGECDYAQNETWGTAYTTGDQNLIRTVEDKSRYFHAVNGEKFFGIPYEKLCQSTYDSERRKWTHKKLDKETLDLAKRPNHGANYNMTAPVLLDTMGIENTLKAKLLLKLDKRWTSLQVCQYLLDQFDITYPVVRGKAYDNIKDEVRSTGQMVGPTGWTRVCFSDPNASKRGMNMYAAHKPQSLAAMVLNTAYTRVFNEVWRENQNDFKLLAQVHDSIIFQYRIGRDDLPEAVSACMDIHTPVVDIFGVSHNLNVPVDLKGNGKCWSELELL